MQFIICEYSWRSTSPTLPHVWYNINIYLYHTITQKYQPKLRLSQDRPCYSMQWKGLCSRKFKLNQQNEVSIEAEGENQCSLKFALCQRESTSGKINRRRSLARKTYLSGNPSEQIPQKIPPWRAALKEMGLGGVEFLQKQNKNQRHCWVSEASKCKLLESNWDSQCQGKDDSSATLTQVSTVIIRLQMR